MMMESKENKIVMKFDRYFYGRIKALAKAERRAPGEFVRNAVVYYMQNAPKTANAYR